MFGGNVSFAELLRFFLRIKNDLPCSFRKALPHMFCSFLFLLGLRGLFRNPFGCFQFRYLRTLITTPVNLQTFRKSYCGFGTVLGPLFFKVTWTVSNSPQWDYRHVKWTGPDPFSFKDELSLR